MKDGVLLRQIINIIDELDLEDYEESHAFGEIYESILKELQSAGSSGEFYTPRAVTDFMAKMINPQIGEKVADFACGTGGFLTSWLKELETKVQTVEDRERLLNSIYGIEKKQFPYILCITNMLLHMETWLEIIRGSVEKTTFSSYTQMVKKKIVPYFRDTGLTLGSIQAKHIQSFYLYELKSVSASTVIHEHANIHKALKYAVKMDLIPFNPADKVERPKKQKYIADYYRLDELEKLFEVTKDHPYSLLIQMTAFYGLRRSEALGLKWDAIDFERNTITIRHIVTEAEVDGKSVIISEDRAKTKSSLRSLPLVGHFREKLLELKEQQKENKRVCGNCYSYDYDGYIFVDAMGTIFNPNAVTENFRKILKRNGLRHIRFHDLRHSCASLLLANDVPMKLIQEWLGHSDISTTANIYSHLDYKSKITSANVMDNVLVLPDTKSQGW